MTAYLIFYFSNFNIFSYNSISLSEMLLGKEIFILTFKSPFPLSIGKPRPFNLNCLPEFVFGGILTETIPVGV